MTSTRPNQTNSPTSAATRDKDKDKEQDSSPSPLHPPASQPLLRVTILCYRNPKLTESEFHAHWSTSHAQKVSAHLARFGITGYRQYHTPSWLRNTLPTCVPSMKKSQSEVADYDGYVELLMPSLECYERAMQDDYYADVVAKDEAMFADLGRSKVTVGWEEGYVVGGVVQERDRFGGRIRLVDGEGNETVKADKAEEDE